MNSLNGIKIVMQDIYRQNGHIKPSELIEAARPIDSPAHNAFEWDNNKAGDEYRLMQARTWIRRVSIVIENKEERFVHIPVVIMHKRELADSDCEPEPIEREGYYKPISVVVTSKDEYKLALEQLLQRLTNAEEAYRELKTVAEVKKVKINAKKADKGFEMIHSALQPSM